MTKPTAVRIGQPSSPIEKQIVLHLSKMVSLWKQNPTQIGRSVPLPIFPENDLISLCDHSLVIIKNQSPIINRKAGCIVVGDLHGNFLNLLQIFALYGLPPNQNYIFLGNMINFGDFSLETLVFLLALLYVYPNNVTLLRGECEFVVCNATRTLVSNIRSVYGEKSIITQKFVSCLSYLPLAAIVNKRILCTRASLLVNYKDMNQIRSVKMPIDCFSDPSQAFSMGVASVRPSDEIIYEFMENSEIEHVILGGESDGQGVEKFLEDSCFALSSDSWMSSCGVLSLIGNMAPTIILFTPTSMLLRHNALFLPLKSVANVTKLSSLSTDAKDPFTKKKLPSLSPSPL